MNLIITFISGIISGLVGIILLATITNNIKYKGNKLNSSDRILTGFICFSILYILYLAVRHG